MCDKIKKISLEIFEAFVKKSFKKGTKESDLKHDYLQIRNAMISKYNVERKDIVDIFQRMLIDIHTEYNKVPSDVIDRSSHNVWIEQQANRWGVPSTIYNQIAITHRQQLWTSSAY